MRTPRAMAILLLAICAGSAQAAASATHLQYVSPLPGSARIFPETNIVIRAGGLVDPSTVQDALLTVTGSRSGVHPGTIRLSDDGETIVFLPVAPFSTGEVVTCHLSTGLRTDRRGSIASEDFSFSIVGQEEAELRSASRPLEINDLTGPGFESPTAAGSAFRRASTDTLPADFPAIQVTTPGTPSPGLLFLSDFKLATTGYKSYLMILRNDGSPLFYRKLNGLGADFKVQPDGRLTYFDSAAMGFYAMNPLYAVVDSFRCGNGYPTDLHELRLLPNGHALLMSYDVQTVDMSAVVPGGNPAARVTGLIIQELDLEKNVVFQWRSWDHFQITDAPHLDLTAASIDYVHGNAIESDQDGNLLISCRHMDEITKIDRSTGDVMWRLGGKNNQFTFVNDADGFTYQHAVRRIANGNITLFDNGNFHTPCFSRAVEYALDEGAKTATLVWQYRHVPDVCGFALGYAQRLPSGNTLICWGATNPTLTEVSPDGTVVQELTFPTAIVSYRGYRQEWPPLRDANVSFSPSAVIPRSRLKWVRASIEAQGFDPSTIDLSSVMLEGSVPADSLGSDDAPYTLRFSLPLLEPLLGAGLNRLEVTGSLTTGEQFHGFGELRLVGRPWWHPEAVSPEVVSLPGALPVELVLRGFPAARERTLAVYDIQGRLVKRWRPTPTATGTISWDGIRGDGARAGSGIYFLREETSPTGLSAKVILLR